MKTIYIASDHAGFSVKEDLITFLKEDLNAVQINDLGPTSTERVDYPDYADQVCHKIKENPLAFGLLICGSGQGMAIRANKHMHIRAALCWKPEIAQLAREHNDANILCLGSRVMEKNDLRLILKTFYSTSFSGGRHTERVKKIGSAL